MLQSKSWSCFGKHAALVTQGSYHPPTFLTPLDGDLYTWGQNNWDQLGHEDHRTTTLEHPKRVDIPGRVLAVGSGEDHMFVVAEVRRDKGKEDVGKKEEKKDENEERKEKKEGRLFGLTIGSLFVKGGDKEERREQEEKQTTLEEGVAVFAWGDNNTRQCSSGPKLTKGGLIRRVNVPGLVVEVTGGSYHSAALTGIICESAPSLSLYPPLSSLLPSLSSFLPFLPPLSPLSLPPFLPPLPPSSPSQPFSADGDVYTWGEADLRLGHGSLPGRRVEEPTKVLGLKNIRQIGCGYYHTIALDGNSLFWLSVF
jgi:alpha-tubulin suppressor-like RCC1 family protein